MPKLEKPYRGSVNLSSGVYFPRTSREAFGHGIKFEKPHRDWAWFIGSLVLVVIAAAVVVWLRKLS